MPGAADDRAGRMAASAAGIEPGNRCGIRHSLLKAKGVVHVVNVAIGDAEMSSGGITPSK